MGPTLIEIFDDPTSETLFPGEKQNFRDYHEDRGCDVFHRLTRKALAIFDMILILDNVAYPRGMEEGWKNPLTVTNMECDAPLSGLGIGIIGASLGSELMTFDVPCKR